MSIYEFYTEQYLDEKDCLQCQLKVNHNTLPHYIKFFQEHEDPDCQGIAEYLEHNTDNPEAACLEDAIYRFADDHCTDYHGNLTFLAENEEYIPDAMELMDDISTYEDIKKIAALVAYVKVEQKLYSIGIERFGEDL